jgi:hypothetical protein
MITRRCLPSGEKVLVQVFAAKRDLARLQATAQKEKRLINWNYVLGHGNEPPCYDCTVAILKEGDVGILCEVCEEEEEREEREEVEEQEVEVFLG